MRHFQSRLPVINHRRLSRLPRQRQQLGAASGSWRAGLHFECTVRGVVCTRSVGRRREASASRRAFASFWCVQSPVHRASAQSTCPKLHRPALPLQSMPLTVRLRRFALTGALCAVQGPRRMPGQSCVTYSQKTYSITCTPYIHTTPYIIYTTPYSRRRRSDCVLHPPHHRRGGRVCCSCIQLYLYHKSSSPRTRALHEC